MPNGCDRPSRATAIASNPIARPEATGHVVADAEDLDRAGEPEQQPDSVIVRMIRSFGRIPA